MRPASGASEISPLLSFSQVSVRRADGGAVRTLLDGVCFELKQGRSAGLYGAPRSGKSTLLRLACGIQLADEGRICLDGEDLRALSRAARAAVLRDRVALLSAEGWLPSPGETVLDCVALALGSGGVCLRDARRRALAILDRVGAAGCAHDLAASLSLEQCTYVALARALVREPALLLVDEPAPLPSILGRERFCALLRELARELGHTLLIASQDMSCLQGLGMLMSISAGRFCSTAATATVVPLAPRRIAGKRP